MQQQEAQKKGLLAGDDGDGDALWRLIWLVFLSAPPLILDPRPRSPDHDPQDRHDQHLLLSGFRVRSAFILFRTTIERRS